MGLTRFTLAALNKYMGSERLAKRAANLRRPVLTDKLAVLFENTVQAGPFKGLKLVDDAAWGDGDRGSCLLGCYESNLHDSIYHFANRNPKTVINIGCAGGYYAVGLAKLLPNAKVFAFDIDQNAQDVCGATAKANHVDDRVFVDGLCTPEKLSVLAQREGGIFVFMDCEGAELDLLDPQKVPYLERCDILVETHDVYISGITELLEARLNVSHVLNRVTHGGRNPYELAEIATWSDFDRWVIIDENRPERMFWLSAVSRVN